LLEPDVTEVYLVPSSRIERCLVCTPSSEALVRALREGAFTFCAEHLLRAHVYGNEEDGVPSLRAHRPRDPGVGIIRGRYAAPGPRTPAPAAGMIGG
jgi:hypothetical protein